MELNNKKEKKKKQEISAGEFIFLSFMKCHGSCSKPAWVWSGPKDENPDKSTYFK